MPTQKHTIPFRIINSTIPNNNVLDFDLPPALEASEPPEARGLSRDEVRLLVSYHSTDRVVHTRFRNIGEFLQAGDLLVINTSGTLNAALPAIRSDGTQFELHLSTHLPANLWVVEMRAYQDNREKTKECCAPRFPAGAMSNVHDFHGPTDKVVVNLIDVRVVAMPRSGASRAMRRISGKIFPSSSRSNTSDAERTRNGSCPCIGLAGLNRRICEVPSV